MKIENGRYWNVGLQLVDGCTPCSPGCLHCWSANMAHRFKREGEDTPDHPHGVGILTDADGNFNGDIITYPERLDIPRKRKKPTVYAVWNDLFHEDVPDNFIRKVFWAMEDASRHKYLVLTKRPNRMAEFWEVFGGPRGRKNPNLYFGLTVCNQAEADEKIPIFLQVPGKKFISFEPALSAVVFRSEWLKKISCLILGCETGAGARPMKTEWAESVVVQCRVAGVPVFVKQLSINGRVSKDMNEWPEILRVRELPWYGE